MYYQDLIKQYSIIHYTLYVLCTSWSMRQDGTLILDYYISMTVVYCNKLMTAKSRGDTKQQETSQ